MLNLFSPILKFGVAKGSSPCSHRKDTGNGYFLDTEGFGRGKGKCIWKKFVPLPLPVWLLVLGGLGCELASAGTGIGFSPAGILGTRDCLDGRFSEHYRLVDILRSV